MTPDWYTPDLSADFLELPPLCEGGMWRFFYRRGGVA